MKKTLLLICVMLFSAAVFAAQYDLPLTGENPLTNGWDSTYDPATKTITYTGSWAGRGWNLENGDFSPYNQLIVKIESNAAAFNLILEYTGFNYEDPTTAHLSQSAPIAAGQTEAKIKLKSEYSNSIQQVYVQVAGNASAETPVTLTLVEAYFTDETDAPTVPSTVIDFEADEVNAVYPSVGWSASDISATVAANPAGEGKSLHVTATNWNAAPRFHTVTFPDGKTLADVEKLTLDIYLTSGENIDNHWKNIAFWYGEEGASFGAGTPAATVTNPIKDGDNGDPDDTWLTKEFTPADMGLTGDLLALNTFDLALGIHSNKANYYLDNIGFVLKTTGIVAVKPVVSSVRNIDGGIFVNSNERVSVYGIDGRLIRQTVANHNTISLNQGVYIVKVGATQPVKVLVK
jgi:hypothetical protein